MGRTYVVISHNLKGVAPSVPPFQCWADKNLMSVCKTPQHWNGWGRGRVEKVMKWDNTSECMWKWDFPNVYCQRLWLKIIGHVICFECMLEGTSHVPPGKFWKLVSNPNQSKSRKLTHFGILRAVICRPQKWEGVLHKTRPVRWRVDAHNRLQTRDINKSLEYWCLVIHLASVSTISYAESNGGIFILIAPLGITNTISYFTLSTLQFSRTVVR